jgi:sphinganine-1-phosphate aldolase
VYINDTESKKLLSIVSSDYMFSNPLHPDLYPELIKMESEIIKMVGSLFDLPDEGGGNLMTGGTESTIMALKAYKKYKNLYFFKSEVCCTRTVHAAVNKACELLDLRIVYVELDENKVMDVEDLKRKVSFKTCAIIASYPCFPYGLNDPIEKISDIANKNNIPLHVDACLGGFITQFDKKLKLSFNKNINSLSIDPHKFGYSPKGSSLLLWKNKNIKHYQYFIQNDWTGGIYASVSLPGSRVGSQIATTWAALLYNGFSYYSIMSNNIIQATKKLAYDIKNIESFNVIGNPNVNVVAFYSNKYGIGQIIDYVSKKGWNLNILQNPLCVHLCITPKNIKNVNNLVCLLRELTKDDVKKSDNNIVSIYGMSATLPDKSVIDDIVKYYLDFTTNV